MNPYLKHYQQKRKAENFDEFGFLGIGEAVGTAWNYYGKKFRQGGGGISGVGNIITGTSSDLYTSVKDYQQTNREAARRNERAWERKVEIAKEYKNAPAWPKDTPKFLYQVGKAYPNLPPWTAALAMPPNSIADAYAQGAMASYLTAKIWNRPAFIKLGDSFLAKAEHWGLKGKKPINTDSFLMSIVPGPTAINTVSSLFQDKSGVDITKGAPVAKVMKGIVAKWTALAYETGILTKTTDIIKQIKNVFNKNDEKAAKAFMMLLRNNAAPSEIKFSQKIAAESQAELSDLAYNMRGVILLAGLGIAAVFLLPVVAPMLPSIGSAIGNVGKGLIGVGKAAGKGVAAVGKGTGKLISAATQKDAEEAYIQASKAADKGNVKEFVTQVQKAKNLSPLPVSPGTEQELKSIETLAQGNPNVSVSTPQLKRLLRQVLSESQGTTL